MPGLPSKGIVSLGIDKHQFLYLPSDCDTWNSNSSTSQDRNKYMVYVKLYTLYSYHVVMFQYL